MHAPRFHPRRLAGVLTLLSLLLLNEWVLGPLFADDGSIDGAKLVAVRGFDLLALVLGLYLLFGRQSVGKLYREAVVVLANTLLLFVVFNLLAWSTIRDKGSEVFIGGAEMAYTHPELMRKIYRMDDIESIKARLPTPGAGGHPSLQMMMRPAAGEHYNSGPEGARRTCRDGHFVDAPLDGAIWMFGGSTTLGSGVSDCETIASQLNQLDRNNVYLNFGVESRGENPEIEHLLLLLRKGYRPKAVYFLDGLNDIDINALQEPLFSPLEAPAIPQQPYYFAIQNDNGVFFGNLLARLPLLQWAKTATPPTDIDQLPTCADDGGVYRPDGEYHTAPLAHYARMTSLWRGLRHFSAGELSDALRDSCAARMRTLYGANGRFLATLAKSFDFEARVYFQPLAVLAPDNPFIRHPQRFHDSAQYALLAHLVKGVREEIAAGHLPGFVDLSALGHDCADCWVDPNHYSPRFNHRLAEAMLAARPQEPSD
ncbi:hypothetical protein [Endothiovibrio diazotrophicus]